jgi:hypothetical protein
LEEPIAGGQHGLIWKFTIRTEQPGAKFASLAFECDNGIAKCPVHVSIRDGHPGLGDLVICSSPFDFRHTHHLTLSLVRILDALPFRVHCLDTLADLDGLQPKTVMVHGSGLLRSTPDDVEALKRFVGGGTNLIVLADEFYRGTTAAANRLLAPFGLQLKRDASDEPGINREEQLRRILDWQARYQRADVEMKDICKHRLTQGVKKTHWFRPCPILCTGPHSVPLVKNPTDTGECFAAVSQEQGYVVVIGTSLWSSLSSVGWPYDNDRLLANVLLGDDAESTFG